jgi:hypothetical protein
MVNFLSSLYEKKRHTGRKTLYTAFARRLQQPLSPAFPVRLPDFPPRSLYLSPPPPGESSPDPLPPRLLFSPNPRHVHSRPSSTRHRAPILSIFLPASSSPPPTTMYRASSVLPNGNNPSFPENVSARSATHPGALLGTSPVPTSSRTVRSSVCEMSRRMIRREIVNADTPSTCSAPSRVSPATVEGVVVEVVGWPENEEMAMSRSVGLQEMSGPLSTPRMLMMRLIVSHARRETQRNSRVGMSLSAHQSHPHLRYAAEAEVAVWLSTSSLLHVGMGEAGGRVV